MMKPPFLIRPISRCPRHSAFTLVEMLLAVSILALMVALVAQLTNSAATTTTVSNQRVEADSQAQLAFSRMATDFAGMLNRRDVDCFFVKNGGGRSDAMYFYTESPGYFSSSAGSAAQSAISFTGYRIAHHNFTGSDAAVYPDYVLQRIGAGLLYHPADLGKTPNRTTVTFVTLNPAGTLPIRQSTIADNHGYVVGGSPTYDGNVSAENLGNTSAVIADGIFRMEFCFQVKDPAKYNGKTFVVPVSPGATAWNNVAFAGTATNTTNMTMRKVHSDVAAVVVTIAVLDPKSRVLLTPAKIADAEKALVDGDDPSVAKTWIAAINDGSFKTASKLPQIAASQVRVYQRYFPLTPR